MPNMTDKFYYIITTDEIKNLDVESASYIFNKINSYITSVNVILLFGTFQLCKDYLHYMYEQINVYNVKYNKTEYKVVTDESDLVPLDSLEGSDKACVLKIHYEHIDETNSKMIPNVEFFNDENEFYEFIMNYIKDNILNKNINLRKILKNLLHDSDLKHFIKKI